MHEFVFLSHTIQEVKMDMDILNNDEVPLGLSLAFARNIRGMNQFEHLDDNQKNQFIAKARAAKSDQEINRLVSDLERDSWVDMDRFL